MMRSRKIVGGVLGGVLWALFLPGGSTVGVLGQTPADSTAAVVGTYVERLEPFGFSGVVLVGDSEGPVLVRSYGLADREEGRPFLPSTVVTVGSITKSVTAAAVLKLQEMGRLSVGDPISRYLENVPGDKADITLHHLLTHTSGLKRNGLGGGDFNLDATWQAVLEDALESPLDSPPGERYSYSNLGYSLLGMIVENASGSPYEDFVVRNLLQPAGMYRTGYLEPYYRDEELASAYRGADVLGPVIRQPMLSDGPTWNLRANGGIHADAWDMYRWIRTLQDTAILSPGSVSALASPHVEQPGGSASYGYGFEIRETSRGTRDISHSGGNGFFAADLHWFPDEDRMFFVAVNEASRVNIGLLSDVLGRLLAGEHVEFPPRIAEADPGLLEDLRGVHLLPSEDTIVVEEEDGALALTARGPSAIQVLLGGERGPADPEVASLARHSVRAVDSEFAGDFEPKFEAMGGVTSLSDLARYHGYDREYWDSTFGPVVSVTAVAAAGAGSEAIVVVRIDFRDGAAAQVHTWRDGRLANVSVIPDWTDLVVQRTLYPTGNGRFESFDQRTLLRVRAQRTGPRPDGGALRFTTPEGRVSTRPVGRE